MTDSEEWGEWCDGWRQGHADYDQHHPYSDRQTDSVAHRRGYQDGWCHARSHAGEARSDHELLRRNGLLPADAPEALR